MYITNTTTSERREGNEPARFHHKVVSAFNSPGEHCSPGLLAFSLYRRPAFQRHNHQVDDPISSVDQFDSQKSSASNPSAAFRFSPHDQAAQPRWRSSLPSNSVPFRTTNLASP